MNTYILEYGAERVAALLRGFRPRISLILGSGWGEATHGMEVFREISYSDIPGMGASSVAGHAGVLLAGSLRGMDVFVFRGRRHWYEGAGWEPVAMPIFLSLKSGASALLITNAAGGLRSDLRVGDLMVVDDHLNLMGSNPLVGPHVRHWGTRFPDQTEVYDRRLRLLLDAAAEGLDKGIPHGIYAAVSGPTYETPAEIRAYRTLGADAVGMSSVPEAILASAAGMRVAALSCITNLAAGMGQGKLDHSEVIDQTARNSSRMASLIASFLDLLGKEAV
jgi:purine-nucleoside phosphorylase